MSFLEFAQASLPALARGTLVTLQIWIVCVCIGSVWGLILGLARVYGNKPIYLLATIYVEFFRGTPLLIQMFVIYFGLPDVGIVLRSITAAALSIILNTGAYQAEYYRGAIRSIKPGQRAAAEAIGMTKLQTIRYVIIPQVLRIVVPQWTNEVVMNFKNTSLAFSIGVVELTAEASIIGFRTYRYFQIFLIAGLFYLVLLSVITTLLDGVAKRVRIPGLAQGK